MIRNVDHSYYMLTGCQMIRNMAHSYYMHPAHISMRAPNEAVEDTLAFRDAIVEALTQLLLPNLLRGIQ